jgi:hypothetical protein
MHVYNIDILVQLAFKKKIQDIIESYVLITTIISLRKNIFQ